MQEEAAAVCTASYRAPELLDTPSQCTIDAKTDVWSVGCTLFNMLYSRTPFENPIEVASLVILPVYLYLRDLSYVRDFLFWLRVPEITAVPRRSRSPHRPCPVGGWG